MQKKRPPTRLTLGQVKVLKALRESGYRPLSEFNPNYLWSVDPYARASVQALVNRGVLLLTKDGQVRITKLAFELLDKELLRLNA